LTGSEANALKEGGTAIASDFTISLFEHYPNILYHHDAAGMSANEPNRYPFDLEPLEQLKPIYED
jgi:hypothetical protein